MIPWHWGILDTEWYPLHWVIPLLSNPFTHLNECVCVCDWERTHLLICVYEWERELTSLPPFRPITRWTNPDRHMDRHTRFSAETLNPKPGHTQEDTHDTEWYPLRTHPRGYPITMSDTDTLSDFSSHWQFSQPTQEFTHYIEGPCFPHKQTGHWGIPLHWVILITLSSSS